MAVESKIRSREDDSVLLIEVLGYGQAQNLVNREGPRIRRAREAYDLLLDLLGKPRIDPDRRDLFRFPRIESVIEHLLSSNRRSPVPGETLRDEFLDDISALREFGILEIVPVLAMQERELACNEYLVLQARNETESLPLRGYLDTAIRESVREAAAFLTGAYHWDAREVKSRIDARDPAYLLYLPYYHLMNAFRTPYEQYLREHMVNRNKLGGRDYLTIHDRYGIHFLQHVYHRLTGTGLHGPNLLTIGPEARILARHPYAWSTARLDEHVAVYRQLNRALAARVGELDGVFAGTRDPEFQAAYREYRDSDSPAPELTKRFVAALFRVFSESLHDEEFEFLRNAAFELFDHVSTLIDQRAERQARQRDRRIQDLSAQVKQAGGWVILEDLDDFEELAEAPHFMELLGDAGRTGVHMVRVSPGRRVCTFALHESNIEFAQNQAEHRARRGDFGWLEPLQALYLLALENPARSTEALHHAIATHYQSNQELLYWRSLSWPVRLWRRFLFWIRRIKHPPLKDLEVSQAIVLRRREERIKRAEQEMLRDQSRRMARAAIREPVPHPGGALPERRSGARARSGARLIGDLTALWESERWTIPVTRELPNLFSMPLETFKEKLGEEYMELNLRGNDRVPIPRSYFQKNRERIIQRINAYFMKHLDARGELLASGMGPREIEFMKKKVTFLRNIRSALEELA